MRFLGRSRRRRWTWLHDCSWRCCCSCGRCFSRQHFFVINSTRMASRSSRRGTSRGSSLCLRIQGSVKYTTGMSWVTKSPSKDKTGFLFSACLYFNILRHHNSALVDRIKNAFFCYKRTCQMGKIPEINVSISAIMNVRCTSLVISQLCHAEAEARYALPYRYLEWMQIQQGALKCKCMLKIEISFSKVTLAIKWQVAR